MKTAQNNINNRPSPENNKAIENKEDEKYQIITT